MQRYFCMFRPGLTLCCSGTLSWPCGKADASFGGARIFLYDQPVDMRKSFEGLGLLVDRSYPGTLLS